MIIGGCQGNCCYPGWQWFLREGVPRQQGAGAQPPSGPSLITGTCSVVLSQCVATQLHLYHLAFPCRNLEQEISFDFGPSGEFAYLYSQCYELSTNE